MASVPRWLSVGLKAAGAAGLVLAVGWQFARLLGSPELAVRPPALRPLPLVLAGLLYVAAHTLWGTFWVQLLWSQDARVPWAAGVRAYFVSQFGKYVPGKVLVLVLRVGFLRPFAVSPVVTLVTGTYETLTTMAAGALVGACLLPWAGGDLVPGSGRWAALIAIGGFPLALGLLNRVAARVARGRGPLPSPPLWLLVQGLLQAAGGWCLLGLSLWLAVVGVVPDAPPLSPATYLQDLSAAALSYVAGFVVLVSPGGLGAREWVLQQVLTPQLEPAAGPAAAGLAAVTALVLRLVWTGFEVVAALALLGAVRLRSVTGRRAGY